MKLLALLAFCAGGARATPLDSRALDALFDGASFRAPAVLAPVRPPARLSAEQAKAVDAFEKTLAASRKAWPGYDFLGKPLLAVLADGSAILIGHSAPPPEFQPVAVKGRLVFVSPKGPEIGFAFRLDYPFHGERITAVRADPEESPADLMRLAVHERFHDFQDEGDFTPDYRPYTLEEPEDLALATMENRALAWWLRSGDDEAMRDFAALRLRRRRLFPSTAAERSEENNEGTPQFVDIEVAAALSGRGAARAELLAGLEYPLEMRELRKSRAYMIGPVFGQYLEKRRKGRWQAEVAVGASLSDLVLRELGVDEKESGARFARISRRADYRAAVENARASAAKLVTRRSDALARFDAQAGTRIAVQGLPRGSTVSSGWLDYPDGTRMFDPIIEYVGTGVLLRNVMLRSNKGSWEFFLAPGGTLVADPDPSDPARFTRLTIRGEGVTIDLGAGSLERRGNALVIVLDGV